MENLDRIDVNILKELQRDCTLPMAELARRVGLSTSPCWRRVKRLQEAGIIRRQSAQLDPQLLGVGFVVYAYIKLADNSSENLSRFEQSMGRWPEVVLCEMMTGASDYLIKVMTSDVGAYDRFLRDYLLAEGLVQDVQSRIVVKTIKETSEIPLPRI
ncbi:MAG: Lrp/AsnC family transcriptional regulator [Pseudomonadota bacterium]